MSKQNTKECPICENEIKGYYCATCGWFDAPVIGSKMNKNEQERKNLSNKIYGAYKASTQNNQANDVKATLDNRKQLDGLQNDLNNAQKEIKRLKSELEQTKKATPKAEAAPNTSGSKLLKPVAFLKAEYDRHEQIFALYEGPNTFGCETFGCETIDNNVPDMHNEIALPGNFGLAKKQFKIKITATKVELSAYAGCNLSRTGTLSNGDSFSTTTNNKTITYKFTF